MKYITFLLLLIAQLSFAQSNSLSKTIDKIDFQADTIQAVFNWVTDNIKYDVGKLKKIEKSGGKHDMSKFKTVEAYRANQLEIVIKKKKGVCEDYSLLFNSIVAELGYESRIISGITKGPNGRISKSTGHTWNAVKVNGEWKLYDPTWGAGNVKNGKKFVKKYDPQWYDIDPEVMKERHFPHDQIWQLSDNPMTYIEFQKGVQSDDSEAPYNYNEMITQHLQKDKKQQYIDELERSEQNGGNIKAIIKKRRLLQNKIESFNASSNADLINNTIDDCRAASELFGEYIKEAKNKRFKDKKWTVEYSQNTMIELKEKVTQSIDTFNGIDTKNMKSKRSFKKMITQSKDLLKRVDKEIEFLSSQM